MDLAPCNPSLFYPIGTRIMILLVSFPSNRKGHHHNRRRPRSRMEQHGTYIELSVPPDAVPAQTECRLRSAPSITISSSQRASRHGPVWGKLPDAAARSDSLISQNTWSMFAFSLPLPDVPTKVPRAGLWLLRSRHYGRNWEL